LYENFLLLSLLWCFVVHVTAALISHQLC